jgi:hypothetical protein
MTKRKLLILLLLFGVVAISLLFSFFVLLPKREATFASYPGFDAYYAKNPRLNTAASEIEQKLLIKFKPAFFRSKGGTSPISFYDDYIAKGLLKSLSGEVLKNSPSRESLNEYRSRGDVEFVHLPNGSEKNSVAVVFARIDNEAFNNGQKYTFLTYNFVFPVSGLANELPYGFGLLALLFGWDRNWHQLDHYTAATVVLEGKQDPIALLLQQHNHLSTYLFGEDLPYPSEKKPIKLGSALGSNELYPLDLKRCHKKLRWPTVNFITIANLDFMLGNGKRPFL